VFDMKAALALVAGVAEFLSVEGIALRRRLQVFVAADEEIGSPTAHPHMREALAAGATALVPEPPGLDGSMKVARKGVGIYKLRVRGREAHAGVAPEKGVSAIVELARQILELRSWNDTGRGISVNVGTVEGGTATNVVAGSARCEVDVRFERPADGEELEERFRALRPADARARLEVEGGTIFPPLVPTERSLELTELAVGVAGEVGLRISTESTGGGSDGAFLATLGLTVLDGLGPEGDGAHSLDEHIVIGRLPARAAFLARLVLALDRSE
jgi:glutamate carboxypeptidase